jgi:hypothetical protein
MAGAAHYYVALGFWAHDSESLLEECWSHRCETFSVCFVPTRRECERRRLAARRQAGRTTSSKELGVKWLITKRSMGTEGLRESNGVEEGECIVKSRCWSRSTD